MITSPPITVQHLEAPLSRYNLAWAARQHKLLPTLASAWQASGVDVEDALLAEVEAHRRRAEHYARLLAQLTDLAGPGIRPFKGAVVAALYPHGWVRRSGDLDIEVSSLEEALIVGRYLQDSGWTVIRLSLFQADGSPRIALNLVDLRSGGALLDYDRVHLQGFAFRGDVWGLPPRVTYDGSDDHTPRSRTMLTLVEPFQRRTIARDVLDFALLAPALADTERVGLHRAMATLDLWPEWNRLRSAVVDAEMLVSEAGPPGTRRSTPPGTRSAAHPTRRNVRPSSPSRSTAAPVSPSGDRWARGDFASTRRSDPDTAGSSL